MVVLKVKQYDENLSLLNEGFETTDNIQLIDIIENQLAEGNTLLLQNKEVENEAIVMPKTKIVSTPFYKEEKVLKLFNIIEEQILEFLAQTNYSVFPNAVFIDKELWFEFQKKIKNNNFAVSNIIINSRLIKNSLEVVLIENYKKIVIGFIGK